MTKRPCLIAAFAFVLGVPTMAWADDGDDRSPDDAQDLSEVEEEALGTRGLVKTRAESVSFDAKERSLELSGNVRVDAAPFHLRSQHIKLSRTRWGIEAEGDGRLAFCPCLGTPLTIEFDKAIVAPPGDLILKNPKLDFYGVPIMWLPWFWMRSEDKLGLLPPDVSYRGQDGLFLGGGVHVPWKDRGARHSLDLRGGGYTAGGFAVDARLRSPNAVTNVRYDRLVGARAPALLVSESDADADDGLYVDARGAENGEGRTVAWDADALRGRRGVVSTSDVDAASKPWDRAAFSGALHFPAVTTETGIRAVTRRGGDLSALDAAGPFVALRSSGVLRSNIVYDATLEGGALRLSKGPALAVLPSAVPADTLSYARAELGLLGATTLGPLAASANVRAAGNVAAEGRRQGDDLATMARVRVGLPMARAFHGGDAGSDDDRDPLVHVVEPFAGGQLSYVDGDAILGSLPGRGLAAITGLAPIADAGLRSTIGRWGRHEALEVSASGGAAFGDVAGSAPRPLARGRLSATLAYFGAQVDSGNVIGSSAAPGGTAVVGRLRVGRRDGLRMLANVATREGLDPVLSRALTEVTLESPAGFLSREGTTGGAGLVVPWSRALTTSVGADADATTQELVAARGGIELRDRCNCLTLRAMGSHRIGRSGVDVWLALDFAADR